MDEIKEIIGRIVDQTTGQIKISEMYILESFRIYYQVDFVENFIDNNIPIYRYRFRPGVCCQSGCGVCSYVQVVPGDILAVEKFVKSADNTDDINNYIIVNIKGIRIALRLPRIAFGVGSKFSLTKLV
jgi:hypothetical protein